MNCTTLIDFRDIGECFSLEVFSYHGTITFENQMVDVLTFLSLVPTRHLCAKPTNFKNIPFFSSYCDMSLWSIFSSRFCRGKLFVTTSFVFIITVSSVTCELKPFIKYLYEVLGTDLLGGESRIKELLHSY